MSGYNHVTLVGNLGRDAEVVSVGQAATPKVTFSLAVDTGYGEHARTEWIPCVFWGERAQKLMPYLVKGLCLLVNGQWQTQSWEDDAGDQHRRTVLQVSGVAFKGYTQVTLLGNLGADAELAYAESGTPYLKFRLAATTGRGEYERTEWVACVVFGKRAPGLAAHLPKGAKVLVQGELRTSQWEDDAGQKHSRTEVVVAPFVGDVVLLSSRREADAAAEVVSEDAYEVAEGV